MFRFPVWIFFALTLACLAASCRGNASPAPGAGTPAGATQPQKEEWLDPGADQDLTEPPIPEWKDNPERITEPGVVALVGDEKITADEYYSELEKGYRADGTEILVDDAVIALESERVGLNIAPEEVRAYAEKMENLRIESMTEDLNRAYYGRKTMEEYLRETRGVGLEEFKARNIKQALDTGVAEKRMRIERLVAYEIYTSARVRIKHIQVNSEDKAREIIKKIEGGADFGKLVEEESEDMNTRPQKGAIYPFHKGDEAFRKDLERLGPEFLDKVFAAQIGLMPEPLKSASGSYHVVMVIETQPVKDVKYADCKAEIEKIADNGIDEGDGVYWRERNRHQYKAEVKSEGDVCAVVGDRQITVKELRAKLNALFGREMIQSLITKRIMASESSRIGLTNTDDEIRAMAAQMTDDRLTELKQMLAYQYPMGGDVDTMLKNYIKERTGQTLEEHTKQSVEDLVKSGGALNNLTLSKLVMHYLLTTERVTIQQAVFEDEYAAKDAWMKLRQGAEFAKLARMNSGEASEDEGVLPSFSRAEYDMRPDLRVPGKNMVKVAFATKSGRFSGVFQCRDGWRIIRVLEYQPASDLTYSALRDRIRDENAKSRQWMMYVPIWARMKAVEKGVAIKLPA